jgi:hypothetical protein
LNLIAVVRPESFKGGPLWKFSPEAFTDPKDLKKMAQVVSAKIKTECPEVTSMGRFDVVDIVESDDTKREGSHDNPRLRALGHRNALCHPMERVPGYAIIPLGLPQRREAMRTFGAIAAAALLAAYAIGQDRKPLSPQERALYLVSAKAGTVNLAEGSVMYKRAESDWDILITGDSLKSGDRVKTQTASRAEILLSPGSYLRLSENTEAVLSSDSLNDTQILLVKGSAIVEAVTSEESTQPIATITAAGTSVSILRGGIYRFNVEGESSAEVLIRKGRVKVANREYKEGTKVVLSGNAVVATALDKRSQDDFDLWSKERAKLLVATNNYLAQRALNGSGRLITYSNLWLFNPLTGGYVFVPWLWGFHSPYGWGYASCNPYYYWPLQRNPGEHNPGSQTNRGNTNTSGGTAVNPPRPAPKLGPMPGSDVINRPADMLPPSPRGRPKDQ